MGKTDLKSKRSNAVCLHAFQLQRRRVRFFSVLEETGTTAALDMVTRGVTGEERIGREGRLLTGSIDRECISSAVLPDTVCLNSSAETKVSSRFECNSPLAQATGNGAGVAGND